MFIGVSVLVPVLANWLRAYMIVMLGHLSGNTIATGVDHLIYGWIFFGIVIMLMFLVGAKWAQPDLVGASLASSTPISAVSHRPGRLWLGVAVLVLITFVPLRVADHLQQNQNQAVPSLAALQAGSNWQPSQLPVDWKPVFENPSAQSQQAFSSMGKTVGLYIGYYRNQNYGRKLVSSQNQLVMSNDLRWALMADGRHGLVLGQDAINARTAVLLKRRQADGLGELRLAVWQFYWVNGKWLADDYLAKLWGAIYRAMGRGDDGAVLLVYAPYTEATFDPAVLESFIQSNIPAIEQLLRTTRGGH